MYTDGATEVDSPVWPGAFNNVPAITKVTSPTFMLSPTAALYCNINVLSTSAALLFLNDLPASTGMVSNDP